MTAPERELNSPATARLRLLGGLALTNAAGIELSSLLAQPRRVALLAYLAVERARGFIRRDELLALFWPDTDTARARASLSRALHGLRQALGEGVILSRGDEEVALATQAICCDFAEFEHAVVTGQHADACARYSGDLLPGFHVTDAAPNLDRWMERERDRLRHLYLQSLRGWGAEQEGRGDVHGALQTALRASDAFPLEEGVHQWLVRRLAASGDRSGTARAHDAFVRRLQEELGVSPSPETSALVASVLSAGPTGPVRTGRPGVELQPAAADLYQGDEGGMIPAEATVANVPTSAPLSAASPLATPMTHSVRRTRVLMGGVGALAVLSIGLGAIVRARAPATLDPHRVIVASTSAAGRNPAIDPLDALLRERLGDGVSATHLASVVPGASIVLRSDQGQQVPQIDQVRALARANGVRYVVTATYNEDADSLLVRAQVIDAESGAIASAIDPVRGVRSAPGPAIEVLRNRVMAALAARLDPQLELWSYAAAMPTNYESYRELRSGIDAFVGEEFEEATKHFEAAAALDTTSATPLVWAAWALAYHRFWPQVEVLVPRIKSSGRNFGPWDRAILDVVDAWLVGDMAAGHAAGHRLAAAVPNSEWSFPLAWNAAKLGRAKEAIRVLEAIDPERGWMRGFPWYSASLARAYHTIGDHEKGLRLAREGLRREPSNRSYMYNEALALSALGRSDGIMERCARARTVRTNSMFSGNECGNAIIELRAHGYQPAAHALLKAVVADYAMLPDSERVEWPSVEYLYDAAGTFAERDSLLRQKPAHAISLVQRSLLAAERGDRAGVQAALREMSAAPPPPRWYRDSRLSQPVASDGSSLTFLRAQLAALLGDKAEAVSWLSTYLREGNWELEWYHSDRTLEGLRGYPPFEALLRPSEEPEVVTSKPG